MQTDATAEKPTEESGPTQAESDKFWTGHSRAAYSSSSTYFDTNVRNRIIQDIRQFQGEHPEGSKYHTDAYRLRSKLFRPKTRSSIRKNEAIAAAAFFSTEDVTAVRPINDDDPLHQAAAKIHYSLLQYRLTRPHPHGIPWFLTCMGAYQEAQAVGVVASYQDWRYDEKKRIDRPEITLLPVENYRFDPAADWRDVVNTSPYFIITWPMYVKDVKARMDKNKKDHWRHYSDADILSTNRSSDTIRQTREGHGSDTKSSNTGNTDYSIAWVHENFIEVDGIDVRFFTLGDDRMLSEPIMVEERYPQGRPITIGFSVVEAHKPYPGSISSITRDTQTEINDIANLRIDNIKLMLNKRYFVERGKNVDLRSLTRNIPASVTMMDDPGTNVKVITTDDATASSYQEQDRLNLDYDDLSGSFSGASVSSNRKLNETVGGMNLLSSAANQVSEYQLRVFTESWVEKTLRQIVILEQHHETDETVMKIVGKNAQIEKLGFTMDQISALIDEDVILTVNVGTGAVNPQSQLERFLFAMKALAEILGPDYLKRPLTEQEQEIAKEIFGKCGYKDGARFLTSAEEGQDPRMMQLMQEIDQLKQALNAKSPPELIAAQVKKLDAESILAQVTAMVKRVEALYSAMQTAATAVTTPGVTPVADAIAKSAGFEDQDDPPIYPEPGQLPPPGTVTPEIPQNTSPLYPANANRGMLSGMEAGLPPGGMAQAGGMA